MDEKLRNSIFNKDFVEKTQKELDKSKAITHQEFIDGYKSGEILAFVNKQGARYLRKSPIIKKSYKAIDIAGTIISFIFTIPLPIILLFISPWKYSLISLILGLVVAWVANHLSYQFILKNTLSSEKFWNYAIFHHGIEIRDKDGNKITSASLKGKTIESLEKKSFDSLSEYLK